MKTLGYLLITVGFLAGALAAVQTDANEVNMAWYGPAFALGVIGVALARIGGRREATQADNLQIGFENVNSSLDAIVVRVSELDAEKAEIDPYEVHERIDAVLPEHLATFVDGRESIIHLYGMTAYAEVMNEFAAGERYLNRVWSASIDGYIDEINEYLGRSKQQFEQARAKLTALSTRGPAASA